MEETLVGVMFVVAIVSCAVIAALIVGFLAALLAGVAVSRWTSLAIGLGGFLLAAAFGAILGVRPEGIGIPSMAVLGGFVLVVAARLVGRILSRARQPDSKSASRSVSNQT